MAERHPSVGETRGVGLFRGIELTKDAEQRVPFGGRADKISRGSTVVDEVSASAKAHGAYVANMINTLIIAPPLTITKDEIDIAIDAIDAGLEVSDAAVTSDRGQVNPGSMFDRWACTPGASRPPRNIRYRITTIYYKYYDGF